MQDEERETDKTPAGNPRAPSKLQLVQWVKAAWNFVSTDVIRHSFDVCGITSSDLDVIHCTKPGGIAEAARAIDEAALDHDNFGSEDGSEEDEETEVDCGTL